MKAKPVKIVDGAYVQTAPQDATHVKLNFPGPAGLLFLPVIMKGTREGTGCWTWNGDTEKPTLRPSVLTEGTQPITDEEHVILMAGGSIEPRRYRCHTWVNDGQAQFLDDCSHELRDQTVDMLNVEAQP